MVRHLHRFAFFPVFVASALAQNVDHIRWSLSLEPAAAAPASKVLARMTGRIDTGWHVYSLSTLGASPTTIKLDPNPVVTRYRVLQPQPHVTFDTGFNTDTETFDTEVAFLVELELKKNAPAGAGEISVEASYQSCNDKICIPPRHRKASATLTVDAAVHADEPVIPAGYSEARPPRLPAERATAPSQSWLAFLIVAFGFGLGAVFTPCVFPMIPITVSYFLSPRGTSGKGSIVHAVIFCAGIIVLFTGLGLIVTAILGPFGVVRLASNAWVNVLIALLFVVFGLSLLGAFELAIPSSILTRLNQSSDHGGISGALLMGLSFSLASFACVGPFVGTLLAASVHGDRARPLAGMAAFAGGLALPFFLLAMFPSYLKRLPRSGGWLAIVKVVAGFLVLAASLKYLGGADQSLHWGVLTRERFLALWVALFATAAAYLLGFLRLHGGQRDEAMGIGRLLSGVLLLAFALTLIPGMFGSNLGELDAFVPPGAERNSVIASGAGAGPVWMQNEYRAALELARSEHKLVLVDFTGYSCTNCHWMKANLFPQPDVAAAMKGFVLVELYTDGSDELSRQNQTLELSKFNTVAIPFYATLDPDENVVATFPGLTKAPKEYLAFLRSSATPRAPTGINQ